MKQYIAIGLAALALVLNLFHVSPTALFGASSGPAHFQKESFLQGLAGGARDQFSINQNGVVTVGAAGTQITQVLKGTCSLISASFTVAASTTVAMDCAVTGVVSGDLVFAQFATSTSAGNGWAIDQASASSTNGFITVRVTNNVGASAIPPASIASSTTYLIIR